MEGWLTPHFLRTGESGARVILPKGEGRFDRDDDLGGQAGITVGSAPGCELIIREPGWEPEHLRFIWNPEERSWWVQNLTSKPLLMDGKLVRRREELLDVAEQTLLCEGVELIFKRVMAPPMFHGKPVAEIPLDEAGLVIGRGDKNKEGVTTPRLCLDSELTVHVSRSRQAEIVKRGDEFVFLNRENDGEETYRTTLNGFACNEKVLVLGDGIQIPGCDYYSFKFTGNSLRHVGGGLLQGTNVSVVVRGGRHILREATLDIRKGSFLGIIGGSGQGKSTLLNALCGIVPATSGRVVADGLALRSPRDVARAGIGYVPQADIVHRELTVQDALYYAARIRLRVSRKEIEKVIDATLEALELTEHRHKRIGSELSGGQQKRVSVASELLASPNYLFLDEPTSGLDPQTEQALMGLLKSLARRQRVGVACTTHVLQNANLLDRMVYIARGRILFHGLPADAFRFFVGGGAAAKDTHRERGTASSAGTSSGTSSQAGTSASSRIQTSSPTRSGTSVTRSDATLDDTYCQEKISLIYGRAQNLKLEPAEQDKQAAKWEMDYKESRFYMPPASEDEIGTGKTPVSSGRSGPLRNLFLLMLLISRQWRLLISAKLNYLFLLMQAVLIGVMVAWVDDNVVLQLFLSVIATLWFGCSNGAQRIVEELPIYRRERLAGLGVQTYLLSKFIFLTAITAVQAMILFFIISTLTHVFHPEDDDVRPPPSTVAEEVNPDRDRNVPDYEIPDHLGKTRDKGTREFRKQFFDRPGSWAPLARGEDGLDAEDELPMLPSAEEALNGTLDFGDEEKKQVIDPLAKMEVRINRSGLRVTDTEYIWLENLAWYFRVRANVLDTLAVFKLETTYGSSAMMREQYNGTKDWKAFLTTIVGLRIGALLLAALVGVGLGLAVSSLVNTPTQAVMWVPLILIPQILFGAFVVIAPDMDDPVLAFSRALPSFNLQRIMDVSLIHGQEAPRMTNKSRIPAFISPPPKDKETVNWKDADGNDTETKYDKIVDANKSWQNLVVDRRSLGMRNKEPDDATSGDLDTVEGRDDVFVFKGDRYIDLWHARVSAGVLGIWAGACYLIAAISLYRRQTGR